MPTDARARSMGGYAYVLTRHEPPSALSRHSQVGVALFEQHFRNGAEPYDKFVAPAAATESAFSRHLSGMYTYLGRRSKTRTPSSSAARQEPHPLQRGTYAYLTALSKNPGRAAKWVWLSLSRNSVVAPAEPPRVPPRVIRQVCIHTSAVARKHARPARALLDKNHTP